MYYQQCQMQHGFLNAGNEQCPQASPSPKITKSDYYIDLRRNSKISWMKSQDVSFTQIFSPNN